MSNVTAAAVSDPEVSRVLLVEQVTKMVRWRESVLFMRDQGVDKLFELGTGRVLSGLVKRIDRDITSVSVNGPHDIDGFFKAL